MQLKEEGFGLEHRSSAARTTSNQTTPNNPTTNDKASLRWSSISIYWALNRHVHYGRSYPVLCVTRRGTLGPMEMHNGRVEMLPGFGRTWFSTYLLT